MSKDKRRTIDETSQKETLFYYEIIGSIAIILSITILGKLGKIGSFAAIFFKVLFGDWYWLFVLFILFYGFYLLFMHTKFNFKNEKIIGGLFIGVSILLFSNFPLHNYAISKTANNSYLSIIWDFFKEFINGNNNNYLGGGMFGVLLFYAIYYLLGTVGVVIVGIIFILLAISLIFNKPILTILFGMFKKLRGTGKYLTNFSNFFKYEIGNERKENKNKPKYLKSIPIKLLDDMDNSLILSMQEKKSLETRSVIHTIFNNFDYEYKDLDYNVSYKVTTYRFMFYQKLTEKEVHKIIDKIMDVVDFDLLYSIDNNNSGNDILIIQISNDQFITLTLYNMLIKATSIQTLNPLGITYDENIFEYDPKKMSSLLLIGDNNSGITTFIYCEIIKYLIKGGLEKYSFLVYDEYRDFSIFEDIIECSYNINYFLDDIKKVIEERLKLFKDKNVNNYQEYLTKMEIEENKHPIPKTVVIIGGIKNLDIDYSYIENKLLYVLQFANIVGIEIIYVCRELNYLSNILLSTFNIKLLFKCSKEISLKILNNENGYYLNGNGDALIGLNSICKRIQTPLVTEKEIMNCLNYIKKK